MSQGIGASTYDQGWVGQASRLLQTEGKEYAIINLSQSGAKLEDVLSKQLPAMHALGVKPALVTVLAGSNDLLALKHRRNLPSNLEKLLEQLPEGTIVGNIFDRPGTPAPLKPLFTSKRTSDLIAEIAKQRKLVVCPLGEAFRPPWRGKLAPDRFHPNDRGYAGIAGAFVRAILDALDEEGKVHQGSLSPAKNY